MSQSSTALSRPESVTATSVNAQLRARIPTVWCNPPRQPSAQALVASPFTRDDVLGARARWQQCAPLLARLFPELAAAGGAIDSAPMAVPPARQLFARHRIVVGSTGKLGFMARALGFGMEVHMSSDAKEWKKAPRWSSTRRTMAWRSTRLIRCWFLCPVVAAPATVVVWTTGGALLPDAEFDAVLQRARALGAPA